MTTHRDNDATVATTDFNYQDSSVPADVVREIFARTRESVCPLVRSDHYGDFFYVSRYEDIRGVFAEPETFSSGQDGASLPGTGLPKIPALEFDERSHTMWREVLDGPLSLCAVRASELAITEIANLLIDEFAATGATDLVSSFAEPLPAIVIGRMVVLDQTEAVEVRELAVAMFEAIGTPEFHDQQARFVAFIEQQWAERRARPQDAYLTELARGSVAGTTLDADGVKGVLTAYLLGGHHSTAGIAVLLCHALTDPRLREKVGDRKTIARAVGESLRLTRALQLFARTLTSDAHIGGQAVAAGERVMLNLAAANRDPEAFAEPETFDPGRHRNPPFAFGGSLHSCQGQHLARFELRIALQALLPRLPDVRHIIPAIETGMTAGMLLPIVAVQRHSHRSDSCGPTGRREEKLVRRQCRRTMAA